MNPEPGPRHSTLDTRHSKRHTQLAPVLVVICVILAASPAGHDRATFYPDDPIVVDPETEDASGVKASDISDPYDFLENTFLGPGDRTTQRATNVNTLDEVPDSSWFTNRIGTRPLSIEEIVRGPDRGTGPAPGPWTVVSGKSEGITPGLTMKDSAGQLYFIKFDPPSNPEMATGAEVISTKFFHALGYFVPENYIATLRRENLTIDKTATMIAADGHRHHIADRDLDTLLRKAARRPDGSYRVIASKALSGKPVGPFRYYGTRPDDPNDIVPHEHRRELRALRAFGAWLNHDDSRSINSLDTLVDAGGRTIVRHHLIDFGSTLGSGSIQAQKPRAGNEYIWEARPTFITILTLGLYVRPWSRVNYPDIPAVGRFEADFFQPALWKPEYPNPAFVNARADDTFWAARRVMAFSDETIRAVVKTAEFTDTRAEEYLTQVLIKRRDKVGRLWLTTVNPLVAFALDRSGVLSFANAAIDAKVATPPADYRVAWSTFDNATGTATRVGPESRPAAPRAQVPAELISDGAGFIMAEVSATHPDYPSWAVPVRVYFRRTNEGWQTVGLERLPESGAAGKPYL